MGDEVHVLDMHGGDGYTELETYLMSLNCIITNG